MTERERFYDQINTVSSENFENIALSLFRFQYTNNSLYNKYVNYRGIEVNKVNQLDKIPFLPVEFFKNHDIINEPYENERFEAVFESSGTGSDNVSKHFVRDLKTYLNHSVDIFQEHYSSIQDYVILALLPSYLERNNSSLIAMVAHFIEKTNSDDSGFYLYDHQALIAKVDEIKQSMIPKKIIIWGVSFALLDLAEKFTPDFSNCIIMETGGMKGKRKEMIRETLHDYLRERLNVDTIHSEYGMTELLSQSYSKGDGVFDPSKTMKILTREVNDPFQIEEVSSKTGGVNIIDLANIDSCAFIETKDIGFVNGDGSFQIFGRFDHSDIRGCNLLVG